MCSIILYYGEIIQIFMLIPTEDGCLMSLALTYDVTVKKSFSKGWGSVHFSLHKSIRWQRRFVSSFRNHNRVKWIQLSM